MTKQSINVDYKYKSYINYIEETPGLDNKPQLSAMGMTTGSVRYTDDQQIPSLFGYPVLSEVATGKLEQLDVSEASKVPGVVDVITAQAFFLLFFEPKSGWATGRAGAELLRIRARHRLGWW